MTRKRDKQDKKRRKQARAQVEKPKRKRPRNETPKSSPSDKPKKKAKKRRKGRAEPQQPASELKVALALAPETKRPLESASEEPVHAFELDREMDAEEVASEEVPELGLGSRVVPPNLTFNAESEQTPSVHPQSGDVAEQIRALEARLDGLMRQGIVSSEPPPPPAERASAPEVARVTFDEEAAPPADTIESSPYFEQQWGRLGMRSRAEEIDDFGLSPEFEHKTRKPAEFLYRRYFRTKTEGIDHIPASGRCIIVCNHSGTLPLDGIMLRTAMRLEHAAKRELRWLAEDFLFYLPFAGVFLNRMGAVRACQENAERLLEQESLVAVFPEGIQGIQKLYTERYRLQRFGRGGYIRLSLRMRAPLVPCAIVGAEETNPLLYRVEPLARLFGLPYIPVTPTFPLLGPLGLLPAPTRWRIKFGEPITFDSYGPEAADDQILVNRLSERVRTTIQTMLDSGLRERQSVWFG